MRAEVLGIGWVTAAGLGRGRQPDPFTLPAQALPAVSRKDVFTEPDMRFGRLDEFSRLGLAAIALSLQDAGLDAWQEKRPFALIAGTLYGCLPTDIDYFDTVLPQGEALSSPQLFAYTLPNCFLGEAAIRFGLTGPSYVVNEPDGDGLLPLRLALETLAWGEADVAVAGLCDLVRPKILDSGPDAPGAVFLVLRRPAGEGKSYGEVAVDGGGKLSVRGVPVSDLVTLVSRLREDQNLD